MRDFERELFELADPEPSKEPHPTATGAVGGVALPDVGPIGHGVIVTAAYARKLGAQLIRAADLYDAIRDAEPRS